MRYELQCKKCKVNLNLSKETEIKDEYRQDQYGNYIHIDTDTFYRLYLYCPECGFKEEIKDNQYCYIHPVEVVKLFAKPHSDYTLKNGTQLDNKLLAELMDK